MGFDEELVLGLDILVGRRRVEEVPRVREAVGADRSALRQRERRAVVLADVAPRRAFNQLDPEPHPFRDDRDFTRRRHDDAEFGRQLDAVQLWNDEQLAIAAHERPCDALMH